VNVDTGMIDTDTVVLYREVFGCWSGVNVSEANSGGSGKDYSEPAAWAEEERRVEGEDG